MLALVLSAFIWRLTGSVVGWLVLFLPGVILVFLGVYHATKR